MISVCHFPGPQRSRGSARKNSRGHTRPEGTKKRVKKSGEIPVREKEKGSGGRSMPKTLIRASKGKKKTIVSRPRKDREEGKKSKGLLMTRQFRARGKGQPVATPGRCGGVFRTTPGKGREKGGGKVEEGSCVARGAANRLEGREKKSDRAQTYRPISQREKREIEERWLSPSKRKKKVEQRSFLHREASLPDSVVRKKGGGRSLALWLLEEKNRNH